MITWRIGIPKLGNIGGSILNKYNAVKVKIGDYTFDSKKEGRRYQELLLLEKAGEIKDLMVHPIITLQDRYVYHGKSVRPIKYIGDFYYRENGVPVIEDVKGGKATQTAVFKLKVKLLNKSHPEIDFRIKEE